MLNLNMDDRQLLRILAEGRLRELRIACAEDQGTPDGEEGTLGYNQQVQLRKIIDQLRTY